MDLLNEGDKPSQQPQQPARTAGSPAPVTDTATRVEALIAALRAAGADITADYNDWLKVGFALAGEFGEGGRGYFHDISSLYPGYDQAESDTKYTECLKSDSGRTDISTLFYLAKNQGVTLERPANAAGTTQVAPRTKGQSDKNVPLSLSEDDPEEMPIIYGDRNRLKQVFLNVIDNALKYTPEGGMIGVQVYQDFKERAIKVVVADNGCGIKAEDLPKVKDKFYKANQKINGSGIGLAVADEIIKLHKGTLEIESSPEVGTTVTITIPIYNEAAALDDDSQPLGGMNP